MRTLLLREGWHDAKQVREFRAKAIRLVREHREDFETEWAGIRPISSRLGISAEALRKYLRQAEVDGGQAAGMATRESQGLSDLRKKNHELEETIDILKAATSFFVRETDCVFLPSLRW